METLGAVAGCWGMPQGMGAREWCASKEILLSRGRKAIVVSVCEENTRKLTKLLEAQGAKVRRIRKEHLEILGDTWRLVDVHRPESPRVASFHYLPFLSNLFESCDKFRALGVAKISYSFCCTANDYKWQSNLIHKYPTISIEYQ